MVYDFKLFVVGLVIGVVINLVISQYREGVEVFSGTVYVNHEWDIYKYEYYFKTNPLNKLKINREMKKAKSNMVPVAYIIVDELEDMGIARDCHTGYDFVVNKVNGGWVVGQ